MYEGMLGIFPWLKLGEGHSVEAIGLKVRKIIKLVSLAIFRNLKVALTIILQT